MQDKIQLTTERPLCFIHLPKSGGSSLIKFLKQNLAGEKFARRRPNHSAVDSRFLIDEGQTVIAGHFDFKVFDDQEINPYFVTVLRSPVERIVSLYHFWRSHSYEHIERAWGGFFPPKFCKSHSLEEFVFSSNRSIGNYMFNSQSNQLVQGLYDMWSKSDQELLGAALQNLHKYTMIGVVEHLDMMMASLSRMLGLNHETYPIAENTNESLKEKFPDSHSPKPEHIPEEIVNQILRLNLVDQAVYEWARSLWTDGGYRHPTSPDHAVEAASVRLHELRHELGVTTQRSCEFYLQGKKSEKYTRWKGASEVQASNHVIKVIPRKIYSNSGLFAGYQIDEVRYQQGVSADFSIIEHADALVGALSQRKVSPQTLKHFLSKSLTYCSPVRQLEWFGLSDKETGTKLTEFLPDSDSSLEIYETLLKDFTRDLEDWTYVERSQEKIWRQYFGHPTRLYSAKLAIDVNSNEPLAVVVYSMFKGRLIVSEMIGSLASFDRVIDALRRLTDGKKPVRMFLPENVIAEFSVLAPVNISSGHYTAVYSPIATQGSACATKVFLTIGDTEFL